MKKIAITNPTAAGWAARLGVEDPQEVVFRLPVHFPVTLARVLVEDTDWEEVVVMVSETAETPEEFAVLLMHAFQAFVQKSQNPLCCMEAQTMLRHVADGTFSEEEQESLRAQAIAEYREQKQNSSPITEP